MDFLSFPRFSSEKLAIWFAQAESVFALNAVITDSDKYDYIVAHIPLQYTSIVEDIILNPPPERRYDHIKYEFIKRMSVHHLKQEELGSETPSEYLQRLRGIADQRVPIESILNTWLKNLPKPVCEIVSLETSGHVNTLGKMADMVMALLSPKPADRNEDQSSDKLEIIMNRLDEMAKQVQILQLMLDGHDEQKTSKLQETVGANRTTGDNKRGTSNKQGSQNVICWYHTVYGNRAVTCAAPCQFNSASTEPH